MSGQRRKKLKRRSVKKSREKLLRVEGKNKISAVARLSSAERRLSSSAKPNREIYYWPSRESRL